MRTSMLTLVLVLPCPSLWAASQSPAEQAMSVVDAYHESFSRKDADGRASLFAEDALWFNAFGARREGRDAIHQMWQELFSRGIFDDASIEILDSSVYELSPTLVVVDQVERLEGQRARSDSQDLQLRFVHLTFIVQRHDEQWLITYYRAGDLHRPPQWTSANADMPPNPIAADAALAFSAHVPSELPGSAQPPAPHGVAPLNSYTVRRR